MFDKDIFDRGKVTFKEAKTGYKVGGKEYLNLGYKEYSLSGYINNKPGSF